MYTRVDEKGKYYTDHVTMRSVSIIARVRESIIHGTVYLALDNRLKDELNDGERFIAVTNAQVWDVHEERMLYETDLLIVNKDHVVWLFPHEPAARSPGTSP